MKAFQLDFLKIILVKPVDVPDRSENTIASLLLASLVIFSYAAVAIDNFTSLAFPGL